LLYGAIAHWPLFSRFLVAIPLLAIYLCVCLTVYNAGRLRDATLLSAEAGVDVHPEVQLGSSAQSGQAEASHDTARGDDTNVGVHSRGGQAFAWFVIAVFSGVYGLEYFIFPTLVDRATQCPSTAALGNGAYNTSWICYNIGVTISRASTAFFQLPYLWPLLVLQAVNVGFWSIEVYFNIIPHMGTAGYVLQYLVMVYVGLMGGAAYANCIRTFNCSTRIPSDQREKLINYAFAISMIVILASTGLGEILDNTILTKEYVTRNCPK